MSGLHTLLDGFAGRVNAQAQAQASLRATLAGWTPEFYIQANDSGDTFQVTFADGRVDSVLRSLSEPGDDALLLRGTTGVLEQVFSGAQSPLGAYTDGHLEVYGSPKDQIKLDVIALVLWGA